MITRDTAARIACAYDEIKAANGLLRVIEEAAKTGDPPDFRDDFGRRATRCNSACLTVEAIA